MALLFSNLRVFNIALLRSGFRPFFLLGVCYGPILLLLSLFAFTGAIDSGGPVSLWHAHEMLFGFAAALVSGFLLTALPGWAGTREIEGATLAGLVIFWCLGRLSFFLVQEFYPWVVVFDAAYFLVLLICIAPGLFRVQNKLFLLLLPILFGFFVANMTYYLGYFDEQWILMQKGLRLGFYCLLVLFTLVGGLLIPIFTERYLQENGWTGKIGFIFSLEAIALISVIFFALGDILDMPGTVKWISALFALFCQAIRMLRWRGWQTTGEPALWVLHLAYICLLLTFALRAYGDFTATEAANLFIHAFTLGAFGLMKMGLMTRVALRHTGRQLLVPQSIKLAYWFMLAALVCRLLVAVDSGQTFLILSSLLWCSALLIYLSNFGLVFIKPSLPGAMSTS